jgi:MFS family permease
MSPDASGHEAPEPPPQPPPWREIFRGRLGRLTLGLFLLEVLGAVQILIVTTVMPAVLADLGGLNLYGWAFSAAGLATVMAIPLTGTAVDRFGPARPLAIMLGVFAGGTVLAGLAPTMPIFVLGRFVQGAGAGAEYAVSIGAIAKRYPETHRARVLALLAAAWIVPGLIGPFFGAIVAQTIGWRWAFFAPLPLLALAAAMVFPGLRESASEERSESASPSGLRWPIQAAVGSGAILAGLGQVQWWSLPLAVVGIALTVPAVRHMLVGDSRETRRSLAWALTAGFLLGFSFFTTDGFVPLMLTHLRHLTYVQASLVITFATVAWTTGSWWQSRAVATIPLPRLVRWGAVVVALGTLGVAVGLTDAALVIPFVAWTFAGLGMGVAYPTLYLITMERATLGAEGATVALLLMIDGLGSSAGTGLGGSAIALADHLGASLKAGLAGAFAVAFVAAIALIAITPRLRVRRRTEPSGNPGVTPSGA